jgi:hypothetical protein
MKAVRVRIVEGGWSVIPREFLERFGLCLEEAVFFQDQPEGLIIQEVQESYLDAVGRLLKKGMWDSDWLESEKARKERCV